MLVNDSERLCLKQTNKSTNKQTKNNKKITKPKWLASEDATNIF